MKGYWELAAHSASIETLLAGHSLHLNHGNQLIKKTCYYNLTLKQSLKIIVLFCFLLTCFCKTVIKSHK